MTTSPANSTATADTAPGAGLSPAAIDASCRIPLLTLFAGAAFWLAAGSVFALIASIKFHSAGFLADSAWLTYGRVRAAAMTSTMYGFAIPAGLGVGLWVLARLGRARLAAPFPVFAGAKLWNIGVALGLIAILLGDGTGFDWLELPAWSAGILFAAYLLLGVSAVMTFRRRSGGELYVSQWYLVAALFWFPWIFSSATLLVATFPVRGVAQAVIAWWFAANLQTVWLGLVGLALVFYFLPRMAGRELQSRHLALFAFWILVLCGSWTGIPMTAPAPAWIPSMSMAATWITLVLFVAVGLIVWRTSGGLGQCFAGPNRFFGFAAAAFLGAGLMSVADSLPALAAHTHFTWFLPAKAQLNNYGFFAMAVFGAIYVILPKIAGTELPFPKLARVHFWLAALGTILIVVPWALGGIIQGARLQNPEVPFVDIARGTLPFLRASTVGDLLLALGHFGLLLNISVLIFNLVRATARQVATEVTRNLVPAEVKS